MTIDELMARDKGLCHICGRTVDRRKATRDHVIPKSKGGKGTDDNIRLAHWRCNQIKSDKETNDE